MIAIIDYGMGNLRSVQKGFEHAGVRDVQITSDCTFIASATGIVLPGVGAFRDAIGLLDKTGLGKTVIDASENNTPILGICLGMQLLMSESYENGLYQGLDLIQGTCRRFDNQQKIKIPHMGWNTVSYPDAGETTNPLMSGIEQDSAFYFVHSYHCCPTKDAATIGTSDYPKPFAAAISRSNIYGVQFHPEKSSTTGLKLLRNFGSIVNGGA